MKPVRYSLLSAHTAVLSAVALQLTVSLHAASATWEQLADSGNWVPAESETNWSSGPDNFPGSTSVLTNNDAATFLTSGITAISINSPTLNIKSITFGTVASPSAFTIGTTVGNPLLLSSTGTVSISSGVTVAGAAQTINAPIVLQPATVTTAGTYTFSNASGLVGSTLNFGGAISGGTTSQGIALTLTGASTTVNLISGAISDGLATSGISLSKTSTGSWFLSGNNIYTGATNITGALLSGGSIIGRLELRGASGALSNTSAINMTGGLLRLDNTTASGGPNSNRLNDSASINVSAGPNQLSFNHSSVAATSYAETVGTLNLSGGDFAVATTNAVVGQTSILTFSGFNRTGTSSTINFSGGDLGSAAGANFGRNQIFLTGQVDSGFLGGWATYGGDGRFAGYDATRGVIQTTATTAVTAGLLDVNSVSTRNYRVAANATSTLGTAGGTYVGSTIGFGAGGSTSSALDLNGSTFKLTDGGIAGPADLAVATTLSNGTITLADGATGNLYVHSRTTNGSTFTFSASIADPTGGVLSLVKAGNSSLTLSGANTYTGETTVNAGSLIINGGSIPDAGKVTINGGFINLTGTEVVGTLYFGSTPQAAGLWGAPGNAGATFTNSRFSGPGLLSVTSLGSPVGGDFSSWASANGVTGGVNGDSDNDGIPNGVEYGLNTNPAGSDPSPGTYSGSLLSFDKRIATSGNSDLSYRIEVSPDLGVSVPWTEVVGYVQNNGSIISANIPNSSGKNFARLRVVVNP